MNLLEKAVRSAQRYELAYTKFIKANDVGTTGSHQSGYHIHKAAWPLLFDSEGIKGANKSRLVTIRWQDDFETSSRFIYYGVGTRNEYRITRFGKGFPYLQDDHIGDLIVMVKVSEDFYEAYVLTSDEEIEDFFAALNISSAETNGLIPKQDEQTAEQKLLDCFFSYINALDVDFPKTVELALNARNCYISSHNVSEKQIKSGPDQQLLKWIETEYNLFKAIENDRYSEIIKNPFETVENLVSIANTILNRRKSRAGKSLEHHLEEIFNVFGLSFQTQVVTENKKKPDFLFPDIASYHNAQFDEHKLIFLASKTTCKDRWRQILNEADRIKKKHLFTLQQGISSNQLAEMEKYHVQLVVPKAYIKSFPQAYRPKILTLEDFVNHVQSTQ